jgi:uncharacterized membrane protein YphA (DoxX/SURF4 family)
MEEGRMDKAAKRKGQRDFGTLFFVGARLFLGIVFVVASVDKIVHPKAFAEIIYNYQILPGFLINLTAIILPWLELLLGLCLLLGIWMPGAVLLSTFLLIVFQGSLVFNLARGLNIYCGCFNTTSDVSSDTSMAWYVFRDGIFLLLALVVCFYVFFRNHKGTDQDPLGTIMRFPGGVR